MKYRYNFGGIKLPLSPLIYATDSIIHIVYKYCNNYENNQLY